MKVSDLFEVKYGQSLELNALTQSDAATAVNFVSRTAKNNGVSARVAPITGVEPCAAGTLSVALGGTVLETFLQPSPYYTGFHVAVLTPNTAMTEVELLWWAECIRANKYRYNYGRQANRTLASLELPSTPPEWVLASQVPAVPQPKRIRRAAVNTGGWAPVLVSSLFRLTKGCDPGTINSLKPGGMPYITGTSQNNGVSGHYDIAGTHTGPCLTVGVHAAEVFYQDGAFHASSNVSVLEPTGFPLTPARGLFLSTLLRLEKFRYNYGRIWRNPTLLGTVLQLPVHPDGSINWDWVDDYMRTLPYADQL